MPDIQPIPAITYAGSPDDRDVSQYIAPPYDVLSKEDKRELLAACTRNVVAIDLPHVPAGEVGPDDTYQRAGDTFRRWLDQGILTRRAQSAMFVYQQSYSPPAPPEHPPDTALRIKSRMLVAKQPRCSSAAGCSPMSN